MVAAEDVYDLMANHFLNGVSGRRQILAGIEVIRMLSKMLAD